MSTGNVLSLILEQADLGGDRPAVKDLDRELTRAELRQEAALRAAGLRARGVGEGDRVALHLPNSVDFVSAALACLWIGAIFVPLAVTDPPARLAVILGDCQPALVLTSEAEPGAEHDTGVALDEAVATFPWLPLAQLSTQLGESAVPSPPSDIEDLVAYAIYTSGTTGTPKGVLIGNRAFGAAVLATAEALGLSDDTRTLCVSPFHFDGSFATLFPTLAVGGAVVILPREALLFPRTFFNAVAREAITYTGFSPSYLRLLLASPQLPKLAEAGPLVIALGGEASTIADIQSLWAAAPDIRAFNRYGPTETTIAVTHIELTPQLLEGGTVPLGKPHPGVTFYLVDDRGDLIEQPDRVGELHIGGLQLMSGYWNAPDLTSAVLRTDIVDGATLYKTGDLVARNSAGDYVYHARTDWVIKRSGVRISLVEVAEALRKLDDVAAAACVTFDNGGTLGIVAFVVAGETATLEDLKRAAWKSLPSTMLPDRIELLEDLPLTSAGKIDERRLLSVAGLQRPGPVSR